MPECNDWRVLIPEGCLDTGLPHEADQKVTQPPRTFPRLSFLA